MVMTSSRLARGALRLRKDLLRKGRNKFLRRDERVFLRRKLAAAAEHFENFALRLFAVGIVYDLDEHLFARNGAQAADNADILRKLPFVGHYEPAPLFLIICAGQAAHTAPHDGIHARLVAALAADDLCKHDVFMKSAVERAGRDKQIFPVLAQKEREPALVALHGAAHETEFCGGDEPPAIVAHDFALAFQLPQKAEYRLPAAAVSDAEQMADVARLFVFELARMKFFPYTFDRCHNYLKFWFYIFIFTRRAKTTP